MLGLAKTLIVSTGRYVTHNMGPDLDCKIYKSTLKRFMTSSCLEDMEKSVERQVSLCELLYPKKLIDSNKKNRDSFMLACLHVKDITSSLKTRFMTGQQYSEYIYGQDDGGFFDED